MLKILKSKYLEDVLLVAVCMLVCLGIYFLSAYFFVTFFR
jgi:hypothetical protein